MGLRSRSLASQLPRAALGKNPGRQGQWEEWRMGKAQLWGGGGGSKVRTPALQASRNHLRYRGSVCEAEAVRPGHSVAWALGHGGEKAWSWGG